MGSLRTLLGALAALALLPAAAAADDGLRAGAAKVDATWHVGASAGQYSPINNPSGEIDPHVHSVKNAPTYGVQARLTARALVVEKGGTKFAVVKNDLYIPQDLLWRRTAQLLAAKGIGIDHTNLVIGVTHAHSSPYYTSTAWGAWAFQDVFDLRAYDFYAKRMAEAVVEADERLVPARVGASVASVGSVNRNAMGPGIADDGTPAGFPDAYTDRDLTLVRFDDVSDPRRPKPLANLVTFAIHGEGLSGNSLHSPDHFGHFERMLDRRSGALTVWTQGSTGMSEMERDRYHSVHDRMNFDHKEYAQNEWGSLQLADVAMRLFEDVGRGRPERGQEDRFVAPSRPEEVAFLDQWFGGPHSHPYPAVSNCRTEKAVAGRPQAPIVGLPDCQAILPAPPPANPGLTLDDLKAAGVPVPDNYGAPSFTGLQENVSIHLQAFRIGDILFTVCPCEQWADQSYNIKSRTDRESGNDFRGFDWTSYRGLDEDGVACFEVTPYDGSAFSCPKPETAKTEPCFKELAGTWSCPRPNTECLFKSPELANTCRDAAGNPALRDSRLTGISDAKFERMRAQVRNCANGWNALEYVAHAESEPLDPKAIKGNFTCDDDERSAALGYRLTVTMSMANDYNGYIATYREFQRGDHYRKALTGWGAHSADYLATRLVKMGRKLNGGPELDRRLDGSADPDADSPALAAKTAADLAGADARVEALGAIADAAIPAYEATLPDDAGPARALEQPKDVERFSAAHFRWVGGSNYTDMPDVVVQRLVGDAWEDAYDMSGEVQTTVKLPRNEDRPSYLLSGFRWEWTAHWEAFVGAFDAKDAPRATPPGTYRFGVRGHRREGRAVKAYELTSEPFAVRPWTGVTVEDLRVEDDRRVSFLVGPTRERTIPGTEQKTAIGPIDYPDSYTDDPLKARFIRLRHDVVRDPAAPQDPSRFEWYCFTCTFRPWLDRGDAAEASVVFAKGPSRSVHRATRGADGRWRTDRALAEGERAYVCDGHVKDAFGNHNGQGSPVAGAAGEADCTRP
jgi:hypothetical protein